VIGGGVAGYTHPARVIKIHAVDTSEASDLYFI
jgi:hypothetical protein